MIDYLLSRACDLSDGAIDLPTEFIESYAQSARPDLPLEFSVKLPAAATHLSVEVSTIRKQEILGSDFER